jgi:hypothetical protein
MKRLARSAQLVNSIKINNITFTSSMPTVANLCCVRPGQQVAAVGTPWGHPRGRRAFLAGRWLPLMRSLGNRASGDTSLPPDHNEHQREEESDVVKR